jgi:hypothetical protein
MKSYCLKIQWNEPDNGSLPVPIRRMARGARHCPMPRFRESEHWNKMLARIRQTILQLPEV